MFCVTKLLFNTLMQCNKQLLLVLETALVRF